MLRASDLPAGRYVLLDVNHEATGFEIGSMIYSGQLKDEIGEGVYPQNTVLMEVESGRLFRVRIGLQEFPLGDLATRQRNRASKYRREWQTRRDDVAPAAQR